LAPTFVIVGASLTGGTAAATLREEGFDGRLVLVGAEDELPYERPPLSKGYLRGETPREKLLVRPEAFWEEHGVELLLGTAATRIDPAGREVELADGRRLVYDSLLLATGGRNRRLPIPGVERDGVLDLRTVGDSERIQAAARNGGRAVIVGLGFIGSEVASTLRELGLEVKAVEPFRVPLERVLGPEVGQVVADLHSEHGVEAFYGEGVESFDGDTRVERVVTSSGRRIECDLAVVGVGIEPAVDVVAGTEVEVENGILVDELCRTNVQGIFAAGDVANHLHPLFGRRIRVEHWRNAIEHGAAAARSMLGAGEPYAEVHWFWSDQYDANIQYAGHHREWDELVVRGSLEERSFVAFYLTDGLVDAAVAVNSGRDLRRAQAVIRARVRVEPAKLRDPDVDLRELVPAGDS
jgi:3-phenylpropionate/trans-cinnamate dioxygenase ferredoxin reductase component